MLLPGSVVKKGGEGETDEVRDALAFVVGKAAKVVVVLCRDADNQGDRAGFLAGHEAEGYC